MRVTVDETDKYGFCLRHPCVDFEWTPDPHVPAHVAQVTSPHTGVRRRGPQTNPELASAAGGDRGGRYCPRSPRRDQSRLVSPPRAVESTWPARASSSAAVALFGSAHVRDVRLLAPCGAALSAVTHAQVD